MDNELLQLLTHPKVIKIMKSLKTPKIISQITKETGIPTTSAYRLVAQLEKNQYLKSIPLIHQKEKLGRKTMKYYRGKKYVIIITPDGVQIK